jgi:hypothetical protein
VLWRYPHPEQIDAVAEIIGVPILALIPARFAGCYVVTFDISQAHAGPG